ncbi:hypothetical protein MMC25_001110 [Agyrium rufum]|nr:hypothetical protein [Agyrium rufum]
MPSDMLSPDRHQLLSRRSSESYELYDPEKTQEETLSLIDGLLVSDDRPFLPSRISRLVPRRLRRLLSRSNTATKHHPRRSCTPFTFLRRLVPLIILALSILITFTALFRPSYTHRPPHYDELRERALTSKTGGRANPTNQKIYIAASIYDEGGKLANGFWGASLLSLVDLLGSDNVFLSIYENESGLEGETALDTLRTQVQCKNNLNYEGKLYQQDLLPRVTMPDGSRRLKRMEYLAAVRNRAMEHLDSHTEVTYDKILFLNDIAFDPVEAAQLLFSTNNGDYLAACSVDFDNPLKLYDTFATRDLEGYSLGLIIYPWFTNSGKGESRKDVLAQKDAVRVKSCWGGMVAADARYFQSLAVNQSSLPERASSSSNATMTGIGETAPIRFRAEPELYYDASECCLIHADLLERAQPANVEEDTRIYVNPYIRVAYDLNTLSCLAFSRRFERLFLLPHSIINAIVGLPRKNPFRNVNTGEIFDKELWVSNLDLPGNGSWQVQQRQGTVGEYCGVRDMQLMRETRHAGGKPWEKTRIPPGQRLRWG